MALLPTPPPHRCSSTATALLSSSIYLVSQLALGVRTTICNRISQPLRIRLHISSTPFIHGYLILSYPRLAGTRRVRTHSRNLFVIAMSSGPSRELGLSLGLMLRTSCLLFLVGDATGFVVLGTHRTIQGRPRGCVTPLMEFGDAFYSAAVPLQPAPTRPCSSNLQPIASAPAVQLEPTADRCCSHRTAPTGSGAHARTHTAQYTLRYSAAHTHASVGGAPAAPMA